jgi:hypothetical protein
MEETKNISPQMKYLMTEKGKIANKKAQQKYYAKNKEIINKKRRQKYREKKYGINTPEKKESIEE